MSEKQIRKLETKEHILTKGLYELVFPEDQGAFADYYYEEIAAGNEIYAVLEGEKVLSMLHLNFYDLVIGEEERKIPYIVAVATHPDYRHQGFMTMLLKKAMGDLYEAKIPFAFLMPADKAIYQPFDFQFISSQNRMELPVVPYLQKEKLKASPASFADVPDLVWFSSRHLKTEKGTFAKRTERYYERMLLEQQAMEGDLAVLTKDDMICGWFYTSTEENIPEVREAEVAKEWEHLLFPTIAECFRYDEKVRIGAFPKGLMNEQTEERPLMMGRILNLPEYLQLVRNQIPDGFAFSVTDRILSGNQGTFRVLGGQVERAEDSVELPIYSIEEIMSRFPLPGPVFLNELV